MDLREIGWNAWFEGQLADASADWLPARVRREDNDGYALLWAEGEVRGIASGKLRFEAESHAELPVVGDWVLVSRIEGDAAKVVIERVLERASAFSRRRNEAGERAAEQVIAANVDLVLVACGLDGNFNVRRIARYLLLAQRSGASTVIVLTKRDLCDDLERAIAEVRKEAPSTPVLAVSAVTGEGMAELGPYLTTGTTVTLLGSSGVGKSTIVNRLLGSERFETREVRDDSKGRHTTTWREMVRLPSGCLVIDTPGMRELQLWADEEALAESFRDVETLAADCRFRDCMHRDEPGCAVKEAIEHGRLDVERLESYHRFKREIERLAEQQDVQARVRRSRDRRRFSRAIRKMPNKRDPDRE